MNEAQRNIENFLLKVRECIDKGYITFSGPSDDKERPKNEEFLTIYGNNHQRRLEIIKELTYLNFCEEQQDRLKNGPKYENILRVFGIQKRLFNYELEQEEDIEIYIKLQLLNLEKPKDAVLVISFHRAEKPMRYMYC